MRLGELALLLAICVAGQAPAWADENVSSKITGKVFDPENSKLLFTYENSRSQTGGLTFSHTRYLELDGKPAVEEDVLYENGKLKTYKYDQKQTKESGIIEIKDGKVFYTFHEDGKTETDDEDYESDMVVPDMIQETIVKAWDKLMKGDDEKVRLLLLERQDSVGFKLFKDGERKIAGKDAVDITMKPSSIFIAMIAPSFKITVEKAAPHRILETLGRLPVRVAKTNPPKSRSDLHAIDARMVMDYSPPPASALDKP